ncbi:MAG: hypothetical protein KJ726_07560 [Verrucomicrobia bacterium]|nr:hypothetical protein [Verrucomicrobiota bacterium]MBU1909885.1 hypothetical protein [Verrucomicrobiota bacterium]
MSFFRLIVAGLALAVAPVAFGDYDWSSGPWEIVVTNRGTFGSPSCPIAFPGGVDTGNVLEVYYKVAPPHTPQLWAFLTDGFWRQTSQESEFLTSYRLFRYFSPTNADRDRLTALSMTVVGTNAAGELLIRAQYSNDDGTNSMFRIDSEITLESPSLLQAAMRADIIISNATGHAVVPYDILHRVLAEQWVLLAVSSMHVISNLTGGLPPWYDDLDPGHLYVGITNNADFMDDGYSLNSGTNVSTHDVKYILVSNMTVALDHDTNACPLVLVPGYEWQDKLVMLDQVSTELLAQHEYRSARNHRIEVRACSGLTSVATNLKWSVEYNRNDPNMVDGDNVQIRLGMDDFLDVWPDGSVQVVNVRMETGNTRPAMTSLSVPAPEALTLGWTTEPGEKYTVSHAPTLDGIWSNVATDVPGPFFGPAAVPPGFLRLAETNAP